MSEKKRLVYNKTTRNFSEVKSFSESIVIPTVSLVKQNWIEMDNELDDDERYGTQELSRCFKGLPGRSLLIISGESEGSCSKYFDQIKKYVTHNGSKVDEINNQDDRPTSHSDIGFGNYYEVYEVAGNKCFIGTISCVMVMDDFICAPKSIVAKALDVSTSDIEVDLD
jgi:hypothetical protein